MGLITIQEAESRHEAARQAYLVAAPGKPAKQARTELENAEKVLQKVARGLFVPSTPCECKYCKTLGGGHKVRMHYSDGQTATFCTGGIAQYVARYGAEPETPYTYA